MAKGDTYLEDPLPLFGEKHEKDVPNSGQDQDGDGKNGTVINVDTEPRVTRRVEKAFEPHNLMLLYDLFFAANMTAFSNIHETTTVERLSAYVGYFAVLWFLWLNVMLFDVRFVVDSIAERILRAVHLGAMVGVSVVAPQYNPAQQVKGTFQAFSVILLISRVALAAQYGLAILRQPKESRKSRLGLTIMSACHTAAAIIYLGVTFRFTDSTNSRVFITWYIVGFVEAVMIFVVSLSFKGLSFENNENNFENSMLPDRMKTATLLILGEGVIVVAEHVSTVVKNVNSWTPETIGVLTATVALIYIIFQIYFDWSWPPKQLKNSNTFLYVWSLVHFPFHLALVLVMEGATQFVVWWKIVELMNYVSDQFYHAFLTAEQSNASSIAKSMVEHLNSTVNSIWEHYPPDLLVTILHKEALLKEIGDIDDTYWKANFTTVESMAADPRYRVFIEKFRTLKVTVLNSIFKSFNVEEIEDSGWQDHPSTYEEHAFQKASDRFELVYIYVFCLSGAGLILMALLHVLSRPSVRFLPMQMAVVGVNIVLGMGLMLLATMSRYDAHSRFTTTPWIIPTICLVFLIALILIHVTRSYARHGKGKAA